MRCLQPQRRVGDSPKGQRGLRLFLFGARRAILPGGPFFDPAMANYGFLQLAEKPTLMLSSMLRLLVLGLSALAAQSLLAGPALAGSDDPDLIFRKSTTFKLLTPNDKLATYAIDDPLVEGVACYYTNPEKGGIAGAFGVAEEASDVSLACRQYGPIRFKDKFEQGDVVFRERRSLIFKRMQIVRGCDAKRNVLVYMVYSDKLVEGSPKNSTSTVPVMPWGAAAAAPKCGEFLKG